MTLMPLLAMIFAQVSASDSSSFFDAIGRGDAVRVRAMLAERPALSRARNGDGATAVLWAAYTRHPELAAEILASREPDFFEACALGRAERAASLLRADPALAGAHSGDGFSGLGLALYFGYSEIARMLVEGGAAINEASHNRIRVYPLHSAVEGGDLDMLELLLARGAQPDCTEFLDATPLHSAAARGNLAMVEKLLAAGADPRRKTRDGQTAHDLARRHGHTAVAARLSIDLK